MQIFHFNVKSGYMGQSLTVISENLIPFNMDDEWTRTFNEIKEKHDESYRTIEKAIRNEEEELQEMALINYKLGITLIDEVLAIPVEIPEIIDETWKTACQMIHKLKQTRAEVLQRIGTLTNNIEPLEIVSYTSTTVAKENCRPRTYHELARALSEMKLDETSSKNKLELLFSCDGVRLYHIEGNGKVTTTSEKSLLRIVTIAEDEEKQLDATMFLQIICSADAIIIENVETFEKSEPSPSTSSFSLEDSLDHSDGSWIYPLVPGVSPCFRTDYGAFILPDLQSDKPGAAIGIVIPKGPDEVVLAILESILHGVVQQGDDSHPRATRSVSTAISENMVKGAFYVSKGLIRGAEKAGEFMSYGTPILISKLSKVSPETERPVSANVKYGIEVAKNVTGKAANVTGYIAGKVGSATMALGQFLAPHIQKQGSRLLSHSLGISQEDASDKMTGVMTIAAGAVEGFGTVYSGLEKSASILGNNLSNNSVKIIEHK